MDDIALAIEVVTDVKEKFKTKDVINILLGNITSTVKTIENKQYFYNVIEV